MTLINGLIDRLGVILTAAVTYLTMAVAAVTAVMATVDVPQVAEYGAIAVAWLTGAIAIIRRVTPVSSEERGLLS